MLNAILFGQVLRWISCLEKGSEFDYVGAIKSRRDVVEDHWLSWDLRQLRNSVYERKKEREKNWMYFKPRMREHTSNNPWHRKVIDLKGLIVFWKEKE